MIVAWAAVLYLVIRANSGSPGPDLGSGTTSGGARFPAEPSASLAASPTAPRSDSPGTVVVTDRRPDVTITATEPGGIQFRGATPHHLVVHVTSQHTIARLGYVIPTSLDHSVADKRDVTPPFTLTTQVYGRPAYAEVFIQTDGTGAAITCTVEVDGKVTSTETTSGKYGRQVCIG